MKYLFCLIIILSLLCFSACENKTNITQEEAEKIISEYSPDSTITDCILSDDSKSYIVSFDTPYASYKGIVDAKSGEISYVSVDEDKNPEDPSSFENQTDSFKNEADTTYISPDSALNIALNHAEPQGSAVLIQNELDSETSSYKIIFRSLNKEYSYEIDAFDGTIISSSSYLDS